MALSDQTELIAYFEKLGLSSNEAKVYLALLENYPITGYQLSKNSGILRPVVYEMLNRLVEKGGAKIVKSNPDTYIPVEIEEFLKNIEAEFSDAKKEIVNTLSKYMSIDNSDYFWNIIGEKNIYNSIQMLIEKANNEVFISIHDQAKLNNFIKLLDDKLSKKVNINIFSYCILDTKGINIYCYNLDDNFKLFEIPKNFISLVVDESEGIIVNMSDQKTAKAVQSKNQVLVKLIKENIVKNIYMVRLWKYLGTDKLKILLNDEDRKILEKIDTYLSIIR